MKNFWISKNEVKKFPIGTIVEIIDGIYAGYHGFVVGETTVFDMYKGISFPYMLINVKMIVGITPVSIFCKTDQIKRK